jgi:AcrR family transcriptional regulator
MNPPGLRERKKQKTRWAIQAHALRLFAQQGYEQTTVEQIAEAAEVSQSTFFRYFRTKEDLVVNDEYDDLMLRLFQAEPADRPPVAALRHVIGQAFQGMTAEDIDKIKQRVVLMTAVPALRMRLLDQFNTNLGLVAGVLARHMGAPADAFEVRVLAGAVTGVLVTAVFVWAEGGAGGDFAEIVDRALAQLEAVAQR